LVLAGGVIFQKAQAPGYLDKPYFEEKILLDTYVFIKAYGKNRQKVENGVSKAFEEMEKLDRSMNYFDDASELSKINRTADKKKMKVSKALLDIISLSKMYEKKTGGAFNIAIGPVMDLWSFGEKENVPTSKELESRLSLVDMEGLKTEPENSTLWFEKKGMKLDLGGVAKGYAVDKAVKVLKSSGISQALISAGSSTTVIDSKPGQRGWKIGIKHPRKKGDTILGTLLLKNKNISTSGDYQQFFKRDHKRYHHILDPKTGQPAEGIISATIITSRHAAEADILSTAIFVMGYQLGIKFLDQHKDLEGIIVTSDGKIHLSSGLKRNLSAFPKNIKNRPGPARLLGLSVSFGDVADYRQFPALSLVRA